jgi:acyl-CoA dehydrogenase
MNVVAADVLTTLRAHAASYDETARFPVESMRVLREQKLLGLLVPAAYGGSEASLATFVDIAGELAGACLSTAQIWAMHCFQVEAIVRYGTAELKADLLPRIAAGEVYIASVTSERGRGANLFTAKAPLVTDDGGVSIKRTAPVVTGGTHADGFLITMRASEEAPEHEVSLIYADRADLRLAEVGEWNTLGMRATESIGMELAGDVATHNLVGAPGQFQEIARESMIPISHLGWSACWLGAAREALGQLVRWLRSKNKEFSELLYERLARIRLDLELVNAYLTRVCDEVERVRASGGSLAKPRVQLQLNALKLIASELTFHAADGMIQLAGLQMGYNKDAEIPLERNFRDLRSARLNHNNDELWVGIGALTMLDRNIHLL